MSKKESEEVHKSIISGFRAVIEDRYDYDSLEKRSEDPLQLDEKSVEKLKKYFLDHLYPTYEKRLVLDQAFEQLDGYISRPQKLLNILITSSSLVFKYGRSLPKILSVGIKALLSFRAANRFENDLIQAAYKSEKAPPYSIEDINGLISTLSRENVEKFILDSKALFEVLHDRKLVGKIIDIAKTLLLKMRKKPRLFSTEEINGIQHGLEILEKGNALFEELTPEGGDAVIELVVDIEQKALEEIFV